MSGSLQGFQVPDLKALHAYMESMQGRKSWKNSYYSPEQIADGWRSHVEEWKKEA